MIGHVAHCKHRNATYEFETTASLPRPLGLAAPVSFPPRSQNHPYSDAHRASIAIDKLGHVGNETWPAIAYSMRQSGPDQDDMRSVTNGLKTQWVGEVGARRSPWLR